MEATDTPIREERQGRDRFCARENGPTSLCRGTDERLPLAGAPPGMIATFPRQAASVVRELVKQINPLHKAMAISS
jgi:hypothetical protein